MALRIHCIADWERQRKIVPGLENHATIAVVNGPDPADSPDADLAGALHEVSNALTVVLGWLSDARNKAPAGEVRDALDIAYSHAHRGHYVARRAIGGTSDDREEMRSCQSLVTDAVRAASREAAAKGVSLEHAEVEVDEAVGRPDDVLQVLVNLLLNAVAFTPRGGVVRLAAEVRESEVVFRVTDEGPGVPEMQRPSLFTRGQSMRPGGAGIGLSHSHALAERNGGRLRLLPSSKGAAFELCWPISDAPSRTSQRVPTSSVESAPRDFRSLNGMRVLVLEDDAAVMAMVQMGLAAKGVEVLPAGAIEEVRALIDRGERYDAAFVDLSPIQSDPAAGLSTVRQGREEMPVILISGSALAPQAGLALSGWVHKPFEVGELCAALVEAARPTD